MWYTKDNMFDRIIYRLLDTIVDWCERYKKYKIDLAAASGETHNILPVPTVLFVVDGVIRGLHADIDYKRRLHPEVLMAMTTAIDADTNAAQKN